MLLMGDFNCAPELIDHCNPPSIEEFHARVDRQVLSKMLCKNGGLCHDVFRRFYPTKLQN